MDIDNLFPTYDSLLIQAKQCVNETLETSSANTPEISLRNAGQNIKNGNNINMGNETVDAVKQCKEIEPERMKLLWLYLLEKIKENLKFTFLVYSNEVGHNVGTCFNVSGITSLEPNKYEIAFTGDMLVSLKKTAEAKFTYNYKTKAFYQYKWVNWKKKPLPVICPTEGPNNQTNVSLMDKISEYTEAFMKENGLNKKGNGQTIRLDQEQNIGSGTDKDPKALAKEVLEHIPHQSYYFVCDKDGDAYTIDFTFKTIEMINQDGFVMSGDIMINLSRNSYGSIEYNFKSGKFYRARYTARGNVRRLAKIYVPQGLIEKVKAVNELIAYIQDRRP